MGARVYRTKEFANHAGVTVRALHHYDRLGLLTPTARSEAGYRLYADRDLARLQQIVTLKFLGFSLAQIKDILNRKSFDLAQELRTQRTVIAEKRRHLDRAISALERAESALRDSEEPDWAMFQKVIEVIEMQNRNDWKKQYFSEEAQSALAERNRRDPTAAERGQQDWAQLIREVEANVNEDPAGAKAQELAKRWKGLIEGFTAGNPHVSEGLKKLYADQSNWPREFKKPYSEQAESFIHKAIAILDRKQA